MHIAHLAERNGLILEEFLRMCSPQMRKEFDCQNSVVLQLTEVAYAVKRASKAERLTVLHDGLSAVRFPPRFTLALSPRFIFFFDCCFLCRTYVTESKLGLGFVPFCADSKLVDLLSTNAE